MNDEYVAFFEHRVTKLHLEIENKKSATEGASKRHTQIGTLMDLIGDNKQVWKQLQKYHE